MTHYINDTRLNQFKAVLVNSKRDLTLEVADLNDSLRGMKETSPDPLDSAQTVYERHTAMAHLNQKKSALAEVEFALKNFDDFGYCLECGNEIGLARLQISPASTKCIDCKSKEEHIKRTQGFSS